MKDSKKSENKVNRNILKMISLGFFIGISALSIGIFLVTFQTKDKKYYFRSSVPNELGEEINLSKEVCKLQGGTKENTGSSYTTAIVSDNTYLCENLNSEVLANQLIEEDSISQKENCPNEILKVEEEFMQKYGVTAVNLCEMDVAFALELEKVFDKIYKDYPSARGYLTNISLRNESVFRSGVIASFLPIFTFADITSSNYLLVIKTQMFLSSSYFLNPEKLASATQDASSTGYFPKNATIYSPVAHEMGHYLSFIALLKEEGISSILLIDEENYAKLSDIGIASKSGVFAKKLLEEAYQKYQKEKGDSIDFDSWRGLISNYALAKDNNGNYIYDETIAEAFHDVYLNGEDASIASTYIVEVLKERLG